MFRSIRAIAALTLVAFLFGCSTTGGFYDKNDSENSEFSAVGTAFAVLGAVAIVAAAAGGGGGGGGGYVESGSDWDQFYNQYGQLVWACRDIQSGRFTEKSNCAGKLQVDNRWPGK